MNIAVANLTGGLMSGGQITYLHHLIPLIRKDARIDKVQLYLRPGTSIPECEPVDVCAGQSSLAFISNLKRHLAVQRPDVLYIPNFWHIGFRHTPVVTMIQNMEMVARPVGNNPTALAVRNIARRTMALWSCWRSARVIAVSNFVRDFLIQRWNIPAHKVDLVYHGIVPPNRVCSPQEPDALQPWRGKPFIFTAGSIRAYRGLEDLLRAAAQAAVRSHGMNVVIAGTVDPGNENYKRKLDALARELNLTHQILYTGPLSTAQMTWCFQHSAAVALTSRVESFSFIAAEAMSQGCLIVSSRNPCLPEVLGNSALYYDEGNDEALARQIDTLLRASPAEQAQWRDKARAQAARFTWEAAAKATVDCFMRAAARS